MPISATTLEQFLGVVEWLRSDPTSVLLLIIDKTKADPVHDNLGGDLAGIIGLFQCSKQNLSTEIGPVVILPPFQRTHVCKNAVGMMMRYCFDLPSAGGLGFRRVQWSTNPINDASIRVAERMGFIFEGTMRWKFVLEEGKEGNKTREGDPVNAKGRDRMLLAACWDDWEGGVKERVDNLLQKV
jgi:RimJ/RimL family protein N-acetyltransferase